jgi:hypothetical protein
MSKPAVLKAVYVDYRRVRSRKTLQLVFEIPLEHEAECHRVLGYPNPHADGDWCAIARLEPDTKADIEPDPEPKPRRKLHEMSLAQQAALLCNDEAFQRFVEEEGKEADAPTFVRKWCGVSSRADIKPDTQAARAFKQLRDDFYLWRDENDFWEATREVRP